MFENAEVMLCMMETFSNAYKARQNTVWVLCKDLNSTLQEDPVENVAGT